MSFVCFLFCFFSSIFVRTIVCLALTLEGYQKVYISYDFITTILYLAFVCGIFIFFESYSSHCAQQR